jgi:hypothetical protein
LFPKHIHYLQKNYDIITLTEAVEFLSSSKNFPQKIVITFDDGYKNVYSVVKNITLDSIPVCIYLSTYFIESGNIFWWDLFRIWAKLNRDFAWNLPKLERSLKEMSQENRDQKIMDIIQTNNLHDSVEISTSDALPLSWDDIEKMREYRVDFQAHGHDHYFLTNALKSTIEKDIIMNKNLIEEKIHSKCQHFSYPAGYYNKEIIEILKEMGFMSAVTTKPGKNTKKTDFFELNRIMIADDDWIPTLAVKLSGLWNIRNLLKN